MTKRNVLSFESIVVVLSISCANLTLIQSLEWFMIGAPTIKSALVEDEKTISNLQIQVQSLEQTAHAKS